MHLLICLFAYFLLSQISHNIEIVCNMCSNLHRRTKEETHHPNVSVLFIEHVHHSLRPSDEAQMHF